MNTGIDLNKLWPDEHSGDEIDQSGGQSVTVDSRTTVYFRELEAHLIYHIREADVVIGCVAWLTHEGILDALSEKPCSIVVQKEDFLRPDIKGRTEGWKSMLRAKYDRIGGLDRWMVAPNLSYSSDPTLRGVRCVGNHNRSKLPAFPRMHNKFVVFAHHNTNRDSLDYGDYRVTPYAVWTGSFNFTKNAGFSLENALYIESPEIANAYFQEYRHILALSEPLDWESDWSAPEWRIGS